MVWTRWWRRWQRWACVGMALVVGAWLMLAAPCALLTCPPQESAENHSTANMNHDEPAQEEINAAQLICPNLSLVPVDHPPETQGSPQLGKDGPYRVVYNWVPASSTFDVNGSVTYTTHTTPEMISHVKELASRWSGPVSVAVFVPHTDFCLAAARVAHLRACGPPAVRELVSWHLFWPTSNPPAADWHLTMEEQNVDCNADKTLSVRGFRTIKNLSYPVNVARNVARSAASTRFVLPSDVELYPSQGLVEQFLAMIHRMESGKESSMTSAWPRVFVVPLFEVATVVPTNKEELLQQYRHSEAVYFHKYICAHCQKFPALRDWTHQMGKPGTMQAFSVVKRQFPFHRWEPIYICTKDEPMYDERLSWEGLQDKMTQMHELCLRDYNLVILDRAFLVHAPGIKRRDKQKAKDEAWRQPFVTENSRIYNKIMEEMQNKFGPNEKCRRH